MVDAQIANHLENYKTSGADLIMGSGRFVAPSTLQVRLNDGGTRVLAGDQVFINVGTHAVVPSIPGLETARPLTHVEALELDYLPAHLIVLGGGYVGLELAQAYRRFGSRVTVIEHGPQLMGREDPDVSDAVQRILGEEGIHFLLAAETLQVRGRSGEDVSVVVRTLSGEQQIEGSDILVAAGRTPNTAGLGLEEAGVELDGRGYIRVNERLETSAPDVWAMGECAGSPQFTHASVDDFRIIRDNLAGTTRSTRDRLVPYCMSTDPLPEAPRRRSRASDDGGGTRPALLERAATVPRCRGSSRAGDRGQPGHQKPDPDGAMTHHDAPGPAGPGHRGVGTVEHHHGGRGSHHAQMVADFRRRFWVSLILSVPVLALSPLIQAWLGLGEALAFPGDRSVQAVLATVIYFYGGWPFLRGVAGELGGRQPGMMTLIGLAITVAWGYSTLVALGLHGEVFFWELATLIDIMLLGHWIEMKSVLGASGALESLVRLMPAEAHLVGAGGATRDVPVAELGHGDRVLVKPGEKVPTDGTIVEGETSVNEAMLTGESKPVEKGKGATVIGGAVNGEAAIIVEVQKTGDETYLSQVITMVRQAQESRSRSQDLANRAAVWLTAVALGGGAVTLAAWLATGVSFPFALARAVTVMVIPARMPLDSRCPWSWPSPPRSRPPTASSFATARRSSAPVPSMPSCSTRRAH